MTDDVIKRLQIYFAEKATEPGSNAERVGWNSPSAQHTRWDQLLKVITQQPTTLLDYGCGLGDLSEYAQEQGYNVTYTGYDIVPSSVEQAQERHPDVTFTSDAGELGTYDYVIGSGLFGLKLETPVEIWDKHVLSTLTHMWSLAERGMAFNSLTSYSDPPLMRPELYYPDPAWLFDYCKRNFSRNVALLHDYDLYDFTIIVRADE